MKPYRIAVLQAHRYDAFAQSAALAVQKFADKYGLKVTVQDAGGYTGANVQKQIAQIEGAIAEKPDAIIIWSTDPNAILPSLKKAADAGIEIIAWAQAPDFPGALATVTGDFEADGRTMATALFNRIGGSGDVVSVFGAAGSAYQAELTKGFEEAVAKFPGIKVVGTPLVSDFSPAKVQSSVENYLTRDPNLRGIVTTTTEMALAAANAIKAAGRSDKVFAVGEILGDCGQVKALHDGTLAIVLGVPAVYYGRLVMATTIRVLQGKDVPKTQIIPGNIYTPANMDQAPLELEADPKFLSGCMKS